MSGEKASFRDFPGIRLRNRGGIELTYPGKTPAREILRGPSGVRFREIKKAGSPTDGKWHNRIILGDNFPILKKLLELKVEGRVANSDGSPGVRLVYIDPPFGTGDVYDRNRVSVYSARLTGARYLEWLRMRIILLRELLSDDGSFYMRIDHHFGHYMKVILDEVFGVENFRNEIIVSRTKKLFDGIRRFNSATDTLFFYTKTGNYLFHRVTKRRRDRKWIPMHSPGVRWTKVDETHLETYGGENLKERNGVSCSRGRVFNHRVLIPPEGRHWTFTQTRLDRLMEQGRIRFHPKTGMPEYLTDSRQILDSNWTDIPGYTFKWNYPTENSEQLLERIVSASSRSGDVVLDVFAGSGTTGAVAEKMNRRWVMSDLSRASAFAMFRRLLHLKEGIGNRGKPLEPAPFAIDEAQAVPEPGPPAPLSEDDVAFDGYRKRVLALFQCKDAPHKLEDEKIDGIHENFPVIVFDWNSGDKGLVDVPYLRILHSRLGRLVKDGVCIIAPAARVVFLQDSVNLDGKEYHFFRVPDSVLDEVSRRSSPGMDSEQRGKDGLMDRALFDLVHPPSVSCRYSVQETGSAGGAEAIVNVLEFQSHVRSRKTLSGNETGMRSLAMISIDYSFDGKVFRLGDFWDGDELVKTGYEIRFPADRL
ncbi:MAG: site-specific DNA-methyltransferase, partial [Fidelibacterota bacterium]